MRFPTPGRRATIAALWGLALGHHLLALAWAPLVVASLLAAIPGEPLHVRRLARPAACFAIALTPLLYLPLRAAASPGLNFGDPSSPRRWLWTLTGGDYLDRFLVVDGSESHTLLAHAAERIREIGRFLAEQWVPQNTARDIWPIVAVAAVLLAMLGLFEIGRRCQRFACAWAATGVLYLGALIVYDIRDISDYQLGFWGWLFPVCWRGLAGTARIGLRRQLEPQGARRRVLCLLLVFLLSALLLADGWPRHDRAGHGAPDRYAERLFRGLPPGAVLITEGDVATATAWYLQHAEAHRRDIEVICLHLLDAPWYAAELKARGLWKGPLPHRSGRSANPIQLLQDHVLGSSPLHSPVFAVLTRRSAYLLGASVDVGEELLTGTDWVEIIATGEGIPPHHRLQLVPLLARRPSRSDTKTTSWIRRVECGQSSPHSVRRFPAPRETTPWLTISTSILSPATGIFNASASSSTSRRPRGKAFK